MRKTALIGLVSVVLPVAAGAQLCKWTDESGSVHYAERCPDNVQSQTLKLEEDPSEERVAAAKGAYQRVDPKPGAPQAEPPAPRGIEFTERDQRLSINPDDITCPPANRKRYVERMDRQCDRARESYIAPFREQAIERCVEEGRLDADYCRRQYADFLDPAWVGRLDSPRSFDFLPECQIAHKCRQEAGLPDTTRRYPWIFYTD